MKPTRPAPGGMRRQFSASQALFGAARAVIPGGVTSAVRAGARPHPLYFERGKGAYLWDVDGNRYLDFVLGYGPLILGHSPTVVTDAIRDQLRRGLTFGAQHRFEPEVAELITSIVPGAEQVIFSVTGSEAVSAAIRIARAWTGRTKVLKFEGHYHGWHDGIFASVTGDLPAAGSPTHPSTVAGTAGIPRNSLDSLIVAPWNNIDAVRSLCQVHDGEIAAIILEPVLVNGGVIAPEPGFLSDLRDLTRRTNIMLIFDEIITGFRLALGGAQQYYGVTADLAVFGKAAAGGIPISFVTGGRDVLAVVAKGQVAHQGTFNGNPIACVAALATLKHLAGNPSQIYSNLFSLGDRLATSLQQASPMLSVRSVGPIVNTAIGEPVEVMNIRDRSPRNTERHLALVEALLQAGVHTTPRGLWYLSTAHTGDDLDRAALAVAQILQRMDTTLET